MINHDVLENPSFWETQTCFSRLPQDLKEDYTESPKSLLIPCFVGFLQGKLFLAEYSVPKNRDRRDPPPFPTSLERDDRLC